MLPVQHYTPATATQLAITTSYSEGQVTPQCMELTMKEFQVCYSIISFVAFSFF
jgi:hypothetical protein